MVERASSPPEVEEKDDSQAQPEATGTGSGDLPQRLRPHSRRDPELTQLGAQVLVHRRDAR
jgi:hypothetical protein